MVDMIADCTQLFSFFRDHLIEKNDVLCAFFMGILEKVNVDCVCLLFVATDFHNFCCCAHISFVKVFTFFWRLLSDFLLLFCYLSCCCFLFAFTLGFLATGLVFSAAPFVR